MEFYKLSGAGNDFIVLNNMDGSLDPSGYARLAAVLCRRRLSVGADGLMIVEKSAAADFRMAFYNADGSAGEMCGNGARCICRYGYERGLAGDIQTVETPSGIVVGQRLDRRRYRIRLTEPTVTETDRAVTVDGAVWKCAYVELGTPGLPHVVAELPGLRNMSEEVLRPVGRALRSHPDFPKGANVNFYEAIGEDHVLLRTYERGVEDFTYACGTGSGSTAYILALRSGREKCAVTLDNPGGQLLVEVDTAAPALFLTGPTNIVAVGNITDEEL